MNTDMSQDSIMIGGVIIMLAVAPIMISLIKELNKPEDNENQS
jgi:hypothetical protein